MTEILILTNTKMINIIIPILSLQSWKKNIFFKNVYQKKKKKKKKLKTNKKYKIFEQKFESLNLCMVMLMAHIIIYQLIMSFNTQIFFDDKKWKHKFKYLFFEGYSCNKWFHSQDDEESDYEDEFVDLLLIQSIKDQEKILDIPPMPPLEANEEKRGND